MKRFIAMLVLAIVPATAAAQVFGPAAPPVPSVNALWVSVPESRVPSAVLIAFRSTGLIKGPTIIKSCRSANYANATQGSALSQALTQVTEYRTPLGWHTAKERISDADRLNGITSLEGYQLYYRFSRTFDKQAKTWSPWLDQGGGLGAIVFFYTAETKNGEHKVWYEQCTAPEESLPT